MKLQRKLLSTLLIPVFIGGIGCTKKYEFKANEYSCIKSGRFLDAQISDKRARKMYGLESTAIRYNKAFSRKEALEALDACEIGFRKLRK